MKKSSATRILNEKEALQLVRAKKRLEETESFDPFIVVDQESRTIRDLNYFSASIEKRLKSYEELNFLSKMIKINNPVKKVNTERAQKLNPDIEYQEYLDLLKERNELHFSTYQKLQFGIGRVFKLVEEYLDECFSRQIKSNSDDLISASLQKLKSLVEDSEPQASKVGAVEEEFRRIKESLNDQVELKIQTFISAKKEGQMNKMMADQRDKAVMTNPVENPSIQVKRHPELKKTKIKDIKINIKDEEIAAEFATQMNKNSALICYSGEESFLVTSDRYGLLLTKDGNEIYSKKYQNEIRNLKEAVYCRGSYYIFNLIPGRILRKTVDSAEPTVWWDKKPILKLDDYQKIIKASPEYSAVLINVDKFDLSVVEVKEDGTAGREIVIKNQANKGFFGGSEQKRIVFHEALKGNKVLTVTKMWLMILYEVDFKRWFGFREIERFQMNLDAATRQENFFLCSVCEESERMVVLVRNVGKSYKASKIQIYDLNSQSGEKRIKLMTELDLWEKQISNYYSICLSQYLGDKLIICGQSSNATTVYAYCYDISKNKLSERGSRILGGGNRICKKLDRFGDLIYGTLYGGKVLKFKVRLCE